MNFLTFVALALCAVVANAQYQIDVRFTTNTVSQSVRKAFADASARWSEIITGDIPDVVFDRPRSFNCGGATVRFNTNERLDDLVIAAEIGPIDGEGSILGQAGPCASDRSGFSRIGIMKFDSADLAKLESEGTLENVILHEMGHVIGIGTKWGSLNSNFVYTGAGGARGLRAIGGTGRPLIENEGGQGTRGGHWREKTYQNELMTGFLGSGSDQPLSALTVESLTDLGYTVNSNSADPFTVPTTSARTVDGPSYDNDVLQFEETYSIDENGKPEMVKHTFAGAEESNDTTKNALIGVIAASTAFVVLGVAFVVHKSRKNN